MIVPPKPEAPPVNPDEIVLQVTITQAVAPFRTEQAIDASALVDERSAIDQFFSTIETLNVLLARHSAVPLSAPAMVVETEATAWDSLLSLDDRSDEEPDNPDSSDVEEAAPTPEPGQFTPTGLSESPEAAETRHADDDITRQLNNLVLLGYISAVESYFRCLTRQLVWVDEQTADKVKDLKITYGAARHTAEKLLPEAFLEDMTFITTDSIKNLMSGVIGISSQGLDDVINEYDRICQLRHCIVHRFGRLGPKNASKLGLSTHKSLFEKPIKLSTTQLEDIGLSLLNFVRTINNDIYAKVLERSARKELLWKWEDTHDMPHFENLYAVFRKSDPPHGSPAAVEAYALFKAKFEKVSATHKALGIERRNRRTGLPSTD